jgi:NAD+ kinase
MILRRVLIVTKRSAYETYAVDQKDPGFERLVAQGDLRVRGILASHREHHRTLEVVQKSLERLGAAVDRIDRGTPFDECLYNIVVVVGGDGTFISAAHSVRDVPMLGVNSAPKDSVGFFCGATRTTADRMLTRLVHSDLPATVFQRLRAEVDGEKVPQPALNDVLYAHENPAAMARYSLRVGEHREEQRSSGVWIGPPAGSRAAVGSAGGRKLPLEAKRFQFVVREPYQGRGRECRFRKGILGAGDRLEIQNHFGHARIFIDGPHVSRPIPFGATVRIRLGDEPLRVLGFRDPDASRRRPAARSR